MTTARRTSAYPRALRTEALEQLLTERGLIDPKAMNEIITDYETNVGPLNGAKVVAKAWTDPQYRRRLLEDGTAAIKELGFSGRQGEHIVVVENTATTHNVVVCTLCSCYPWPVLGLPPSWYKDPAYRSRMVREPRTVLSEMGLDLADDVQITVRDSTSEVRWLVLPAASGRHRAPDRGRTCTAGNPGRDGRRGESRRRHDRAAGHRGPGRTAALQRRARVRRAVGEPRLRHGCQLVPRRACAPGRISRPR